jgi:hypothetical protein
MLLRKIAHIISIHFNAIILTSKVPIFISVPKLGRGSGGEPYVLMRSIKSAGGLLLMGSDRL